jgi:leucyl-tRNA synthetase
VWRLISEAAPALAAIRPQAQGDGDAGAVSRAAHKILKAVGDDIGKLAFNRAVARIYELVNLLQAPAAEIIAGNASAEKQGAVREAVDILIAMIAPMTPHLAEECWAALGGSEMVAERAWPEFDPALVVDDQVVYPVQVNGKKRGDLTIARDADQSAVEKAALDLDFVQKALEGKTPRKVIVVPQRIVNVVA